MAATTFTAGFDSLEVKVAYLRRQLQALTRASLDTTLTAEQREQIDACAAAIFAYLLRLTT